MRVNVLVFFLFDYIIVVQWWQKTWI